MGRGCCNGYSEGETKGYRGVTIPRIVRVFDKTHHEGSFMITLRVL